MCLFVYPIGWIKYIKNDIFYLYIRMNIKEPGNLFIVRRPGS